MFTLPLRSGLRGDEEHVTVVCRRQQLCTSGRSSRGGRLGLGLGGAMADEDAQVDKLG